MTNSEIALLLRQVAATFEIKDDNLFRARAYQNAAASIEKLSIPIKELWQANRLSDIPGIGPNLKQHLDELFRSGSVQHFHQETKDFPQGMFTLMSVPGVGAKTAYTLAKTFNLNNEGTAIKHLLIAAKAGKIRELPNFGEKSEQEILQALQQTTRKEDRMLLPEALPVAIDVIRYLQKSPAVLGAEALGSLRRHAPTVGDVDIAVSTTDPDSVVEHLKVYPRLTKILATGENVTRFVHASGKQVDVKTQEPQTWGSILQHYTGSKLHNIHLRSYAQRQGWSLSEYGIKTNNELKTFTNEESFYHFLGMDYIPPELREDMGEIEAAVKHSLPSLISAQDIKGDLHVHTNIDVTTSHDLGHSSVAEILAFAESRGYEYIGFADHNPRISNLTAEDRFQILKHRKDIIYKNVEAFNAKHHTSIQVLIGLEVDIRPNGDLALEDETLNILDYAIASIHSQFEQDKKTATERILKALTHPKVKIVGHPTGRILLHRQGLEYDWPQIFSACRESSKILEVNSAPDRLDLPDSLVRQAIQAGVKLVIDTDAHSVQDLELMPFGVANARRGWAEKKDIINTLSFKEIKPILS